MNQIICMLLAVQVLFTMTADQQGELGFTPNQEQQQIAQDDRPEEPVMEDPGPGEEIPFPGLPVYLETKAWAEKQAAINADGPPPEVPDGRFAPYVFDHFDDPPPEDTIRLVYVYNYGKTEVLMVDNEATISNILGIVDAFKVSDYNSGPFMGGSEIQIQVVRDGIHQCYSVISGRHNGSCIAVNSRDAENWYETSEGNFQLLVNCFGVVAEMD